MRKREGFRHLFSSVYRSELLAVEARRRRYRIERTLGIQPEVPKTIPSPPPSPQPKPVRVSSKIVPAPTLENLQKLQEEVEKARLHLETLRHPPEVPPTQPLPNPSGATHA